MSHRKNLIPTPVRGETLELEADHRRHAEIENAIRDLKYGVGLNHLPSCRFAANGAWLAVQVMAHTLDTSGGTSFAGRGRWPGIRSTDQVCHVVISDMVRKSQFLTRRWWFD